MTTFNVGDRVRHRDTGMVGTVHPSPPRNGSAVGVIWDGVGLDVLPRSPSELLLVKEFGRSHRDMPVADESGDDQGGILGPIRIRCGDFGIVTIEKPHPLFDDGKGLLVSIHERSPTPDQLRAAASTLLDLALGVEAGG